MNEIPDLHDDLTFLKKFDSLNKVWKEFDAPTNQGKAKVRANFLLHPKRLSSDSECSTIVNNSPRKSLSGTNFGKLGLREPNNNVDKPLDVHAMCACTTNDEKNCIETEIGDRMELKTSTTKTLVTRKSSKSLNSNQCEAFNKKFKALVERCLKVLTNIRLMIEEGIAPPDGEEDYFRRTRRLQEFSARFSRNYLYPLLRQMDELSLPEKLGQTVINQKFLYAQQVILQGLRAYFTHLPSSVGRCGSDKLKSLLDQIIYMCHLYEMLKKNSNAEIWEFVSAMRSHVELLLEAITTFDLKFADKKPQVTTEAPKKSKPQGNKPGRLNKCSQFSKSKSKLSMYITNSGFKKELEIRKGIDTVKKKKYSVKSRYKTAGFKHRPAVEKQTAYTNVPNKIKLFNKGSSGLLKSTQGETPIREDDIKTMVEIDSELEAPPNTRENQNHEIVAPDSQQLVQDSDRMFNEGFENGNVDKALEVLRKFFEKSSKNLQVDFLEKIASEVDKRKEEKGSSQSDKSKKKLKEPVTIVTGAKNAKLICIRDDNSVDDSDEFCKVDKEIMTEEEVRRTSSGTQTALKDDRRCGKSTIKISRLPKHNRKTLTLLPKDYAINIIQYKLRYNHFHKHNPIYRKSVHIQPWTLMANISDNLLDYILRSVTRELEVNEILENLYHAEFQY